MGKKFLNIFLSSLICASLITTPVFAVPAEETVTTEEKVDESPDENGHYSVEYTHDIEPDTNKLPNWPKGPLINSESAILMDMETGEILYSKSPYKKQYPASITKLLTVLVALEYVQPGDTVKFSQASIDFLKEGDAHIAMQPGEVISIEDALYAVLFASANEVSYAVAENVGEKYLNGGYNEFIEKMNEKSKELGCENSHWANANGLHDEEHYTSAYDMALIGAEIYKQPLFNEMMEEFQHEIPPTNLVDEPRVFQQHHKMTWKNGKYYYENCKGGKTGYTDNAQTTLVTLADDGERQFVAVILYDRGGEAYNQTRALFDYGYGKFKKVKLSDINENSDIESYVDPEASISLPDKLNISALDEHITADINNEGRGRVIYTYKKNPLGSFEVELTDDAYKKYVGDKELRPDKILDDGDKEASEKFKHTLMISCIVVIVLILVVFTVFIIKLHMYRKRKRLRAKRARMRKASNMSGKRPNEEVRTIKKKNKRR